MGKPTTQNNNFINHFSHLHPLQLTPATASSPPCSGCKQAGGSGRVYSCRPCNFSLHESCSKMKQVITHPSHPSHTLTLLVTPVYDGGYFNCDACGVIGTGFSYQCSRCDFDIHALCAYKPLSLLHRAHPHHSLNLAFQSPYGANKGFSCDVCSKLGKNQWLYRCVPCEFDAHIGCITVASTPQPQHLQHSNSAPNPHAHHVGQPQHPNTLPMTRPRPRPSGSFGNSGRPSGPNSQPGRPSGPNSQPGRPNGPTSQPGRHNGPRPVGNPNRPMTQNTDTYGPRIQNTNLGFTGQAGPIGPNELTGQAGESLGQGSMNGTAYNDSAGNEEFVGGEVDLEIEYEADALQENEENGEAYDEEQNVNADGNRLTIVTYGADYSAARSESDFGGSSDARSQCNDLPDADLYPQGPVRVNQGSGRGRRQNASPSSSNSSSPRSSRSGRRGGLQVSNNPIQNPRAAPRTRRVPNVRNGGNNAMRAGVSVGVNSPRDVSAFNGPHQGFDNGPPQGFDNATGGVSNAINSPREIAASNGPPQGFDNGPQQGFDNGPIGGPSNAIDGCGNNYNYSNEVNTVDMYGVDDNVAGYDENYGYDYAGGEDECDFEAGGGFVDDGNDYDEAYDESYGENDFESYTGGSDSMYGDESYGPMDGSQYSNGLGGEPNNQFSPMVGPVGGPGFNNQNMGTYGRGGARNMNMYGNMNQGMQPRAMGRGRAGQYRPNGGVNGLTRGPNRPNGNTAMNPMVKNLCQGFAMNMLLGVGGDVLGGGGDGGGSSLLGGLFGGGDGGDSSALGGLFGGGE